MKKIISHVDKLIVLIFLLPLSYLGSFLIQHPTTVSAESPDPKEILTAAQPIHTDSRFDTKLKTTVETIARQVVTKDDPDKELDDDTVMDEGSDGKKTTVYRIAYYEGAEYSRDVVSVDISPAKDKIISHGTKIVWRDLQTPDGTISYWRKMRVWATDYDSHCPGCDKTTAIGMTQGKGVIAVDPKVIKLRSKLYVPGYGMAVAGDTGGAVKGNIIDLGFEEAKTSGWQSHYVDIFLIN